MSLFRISFRYWNLWIIAEQHLAKETLTFPWIHFRLWKELGLNKVCTRSLADTLQRQSQTGFSSWRQKALFQTGRTDHHVEFSSYILHCSAPEVTHCRLLDVEIVVQCCFTSTETLRTIRDGEPRMATSTFTQLLSSDNKIFSHPY